MTADVPSSQPGWTAAGGSKLKPRDVSPGATLLACLCLAVAIFLLDLFTPRGISVAALYVIPIILVQRARSMMFTMITAVVCAGLASLGIVLAPDIGEPSYVVLSDYTIMLVTLTAAAAIGIIANRRAAQLQTMSKLLTMCAWTKKVKVQGEWIPIEDYLMKHLGVTITHGMTEESARQFLADAGIELEKEE